MLFRIVTPRRSKSGSVTIRKGIPKDVRADYERLYGPGWEAKLTLPAGTPPQEAKVRIGEFTAEIETRIATIRAAKKGEGQALTTAAGIRARRRMVRLVRQSPRGEPGPAGEME